MKLGRSHRLQSHHDRHDDWVDGSWTVDCVCGVNFDDGEEMVNCDDCGVWVHTRCSRYVKGDDLFTCDKCKSNNSNNNNPEETEVAQLLVELPNKTIPLVTSSAASRRPFRLPVEERVHVQGIPGGDSALFGGLSSIFSPELWRSTGYVPKKFNFHYREFPCWDENNGDPVHHEGTLNSVLAAPSTALIGLRSEHDEEGCDTKDEDIRHRQIGAKKERSLLRHVVVPSDKRKREELGSSKDIPSGNKKARAVDKEEDSAKRSLHASARSVFASTSNGKPLDFYEDRSSKSFKNNIQGTQNENLRDPLLPGFESGKSSALGSGSEKPRNNLKHPLEALSLGTSKDNSPIGSGSKEGMHSPVVVAVLDESAKVMASPLLEHADVGKSHGKVEGDSIPNVNLDGNLDVSSANDVRPPNNELTSAAAEVKGNQTESGDDMYPSSSFVNPNLEVDVDNTKPKGVLNYIPLPDYSKYGMFIDNKLEFSKVNRAELCGSIFIDCRAQEVVKTSEAIGDYNPDEAQELTSDSCQPEQELDSVEGAMATKKCTSEDQLSSGLAEELSISSGLNLSVPGLPSQHKMVTGKSSSSSSVLKHLKSSTSENFRSVDVMKSAPHSKQVVLAEFDTGSKKPQVTSDIFSDKDHLQLDKSIELVKEHQKTSCCSSSKVINSSKISVTSLCKRTVSDAKDSLLHFSKAPLYQSFNETAGSIQNECRSLVQNRASSSAVPLRSEKFNHFSSQPQSKANHAILINSSTAAKSPAALSDEELALLLHQELNSSPRVHRIPRVHHAGGIMQLASPTAAGLENCASSGGKDYSSSSKRKNRNGPKDWVCCFHEHDNQDKKTDRVSLSPDWKRPDTGYLADMSSKREGNSSPTSIYSIKKNAPAASTSTLNSGPSSSTEFNDQHVSSVCNPLRTISDEETGTIRGSVHQTLPRLINEIMSKGKRLTYRHEWARLVDRGPEINASREEQKFDTEDLEDTDDDDARAQKWGESKSLESQKEDYPRGNRKAWILKSDSITDDDDDDDDDSGIFSNSIVERLIFV